MHDLTEKYVSYVDAQANSLTGQQWIGVLETARFTHVEKDKMKEWEANFDTIVDLQSIDTILNVGA